MPAKSKKQQRFMGMVYAAKRGKLKSPSKAVAKAAKGMSLSDAKDYAGTKRKNLPMRSKKAAVMSKVLEALKGVMANRGDISLQGLAGASALAPIGALGGAAYGAGKAPDREGIRGAVRGTLVGTGTLGGLGAGAAMGNAVAKMQAPGSNIAKILGAIIGGAGGAFTGNRLSNYAASSIVGPDRDRKYNIRGDDKRSSFQAMTSVEKIASLRRLSALKQARIANV